MRDNGAFQAQTTASQLTLPGGTRRVPPGESGAEHRLCGRAPPAAKALPERAATAMGISACMIVRNEERLLGRCLKSFEGAFDELNVVDTGSTDATPAIAERLGARVRSFTACNGEDGLIRDFALARNASLEMASHEWVLWMDADHVLQPGGAER